ncbi:MAG: 2-oxoacid:acceptor oxidoreductase family protein, partial [Planctomycetes bacterium]|nr:2-oxoacid:acceptor oxidoreductase family protein [Planctomycetota bacterium]
MTDNNHPKYPGIRVTTNGNQLIASYTEPLMAEAGVFYPITPSTEQGENFQLQYAKGVLNAFGDSFIAIEAEGEHAAQGGAIAVSITGKRTVNFTSGQGIVYGLEQYYHAPGKLTTMVLEVGARALTKHALNVHCGHDDIYAAFDTTWTMLFGKDAQQCCDQAIILRKVNELALNPGMNIQDGFLTTHMERTFHRPEPELIREFLGRSDDTIECPTAAQRELFGPLRRRVPEIIDLKNPQLIGPVQNQEHYMNGVAARRNHFTEDILGFLEDAYEEFGELTGRKYGLITEYKCDDAETVFVALGSAAENIEAAVDSLRAEGEKVGVLHPNVLRPFPEAAIAKALKGKKHVIVLERTDESMSGDNPLTREIRATLYKAVSNFKSLAHAHIPTSIDPATELPDLFSGSYGLGSRDFRPEGIFGAYEYANGQIARQDGKKASDGEHFFYVGINHDYAVVSKKTPSLLPDNAIAIRLHSIGGWGMITTGKNLSEILGTFSSFVAKRDNILDANGDYKEVVDIAANAKYGSEKKGAPTNYYVVAAPERIRMNCELLHVNVVLCCDPKIFLHDNPLVGLSEGGAFVWESSEKTSAEAWQRIPPKYRKEILDKKIRVFALGGFDIAKAATSRPDLQTRMQGNSFLGGFFKVSSFLSDYKIEKDEFESTVKAQYQKKFGRFGDAVIESNMTVMKQGFDTIFEVEHGTIDDPDRSGFVGTSICPTNYDLEAIPEDRVKPPVNTREKFYSEYKSGMGYNQPASPLASVGVMAAATGSDASKYVARREVPIWIAENCTQCMDCIVVCPDTALPNTAQDINTVLATAVRSYVTDDSAKKALMKAVPVISDNARDRMKEVIGDKGKDSFASVVAVEIDKVAAA